ncbi:DUF6392 family protein [Pseudomonas sp. D2002]|uniref:DUF6392 family protein n=1 Tax=Pseudomonas sp. D2002 TaxID=2726980 RepID=UPI0015A49083|nr:DUF6392 family protein [Pseudomonas sp. D2002]NWA82465.1 pyocin immunity protein [Pseudomonas sp. D2002]
MNAAMINGWVKNLGRAYADLVTEGVIPAQALTPLLDDVENNELIQYPVKGVELWFLEKNKTLEKVLLTLIQTDGGEPIYTGSLPSPFELHMSQSSVRSQLGAPMKSIGPTKIPGSGEKVSGGWDAYRLHQEIHPNARVGFSYTADMMVKTLAFALIDSDHS